MRNALAYQTPNVHVAEDIRLYDKRYLITLRAAAYAGIACSHGQWCPHARLE